MAQNWDYAKLSKAAKAAEGPEKYVEMLELASKEAGKMEMLPWLGVAAMGASLLTATTIKVVDSFKSRKKNNEAEIEKAKAEIINGIKEYDATHPEEEEMLVLGINKILNWCQITSGGRTYTCPTKLIDGKLFFHFKKEWHSVAEFVSDHAEEFVSEGGKVFSRPFKK